VRRETFAMRLRRLRQARGWIVRSLVTRKSVYDERGLTVL
jgi:hypothetical protein